MLGFGPISGLPIASAGLGQIYVVAISEYGYGNDPSTAANYSSISQLESGLGAEALSVYKTLTSSLSETLFSKDSYSVLANFLSSAVEFGQGNDTSTVAKYSSISQLESGLGAEALSVYKTLTSSLAETLTSQEYFTVLASFLGSVVEPSSSTDSVNAAKVLVVIGIDYASSVDSSNRVYYMPVFTSEAAISTEVEIPLALLVSIVSENASSLDKFNTLLQGYANVSEGSQAAELVTWYQTTFNSVLEAPRASDVSSENILTNAISLETTFTKDTLKYPLGIQDATEIVDLTDFMYAIRWRIIP